MSALLQLALIHWRVTTFQYPSGQHGVLLFAPEGSFNRVIVTFDDVVHATNKGCSAEEFAQVLAAIKANTDVLVEDITHKPD